MRKTLLASLITFPLLGLSAPAAIAGSYGPTYESGSHWYVTAGLGTGRYHLSANGVSGSKGGNGLNAQLLGGWQYLTQHGDGGGVELGYLHGSKARESGYVGPAAASVNLHTNGWTLGLAGRVHIISGWFLSARGGYFRSDTSIRVAAGNQYVSTSQNGDGTYLGIGTGIDINPSNSISLRYDRYWPHLEGTSTSDTYLDSFTVNYTYRF